MTSITTSLTTVSYQSQSSIIRRPQTAGYGKAYISSLPTGDNVKITDIIWNTSSDLPAYYYGADNQVSYSATTEWSQKQFLQLADTDTQTITGPVAFSGATIVPSVSAFTGADALNALSAEGRYVKSVPASGSTNVRIVDVQNDTSGDLIATRADGTTQSYAPVTTGTFANGRWRIIGNILELWWVQHVMSTQNVVFPKAFALAPWVEANQRYHTTQLPNFGMGFGTINPDTITATSFDIYSLVIQDNRGTYFPGPGDGVDVAFYAVGEAS